MDILIIVGIVAFSIWYLWKSICKQSRGNCSCDGCDMNCSMKEINIDID